MKAEGIMLPGSSVERLTQCRLPLRIRSYMPIDAQQIVGLGITQTKDTRVTIMKETQGEFTMIDYKDLRNGKDHIVIVKDIGDGKNVPVRIHSSCITAETFHAATCDCEEQLNTSLGIIEDAGRGALIWLNQEGMDNGLTAKLAQLDAEDKTGSFDAITYDGHLFVDRREYQAAADILKDLGVTSVSLITNNQAKIDDLKRLGIDVVSRIPYISGFDNEIANAYLKSRRERGYLDDTLS